MTHLSKKQADTWREVRNTITDSIRSLGWTKTSGVAKEHIAGFSKDGFELIIFMQSKSSDLERESESVPAKFDPLFITAALADTHQESEFDLDFIRSVLAKNAQARESAKAFYRQVIDQLNAP